MEKINRYKIENRIVTFETNEYNILVVFFFGYEFDELVKCKKSITYSNIIPVLEYIIL